MMNVQGSPQPAPRLVDVVEPANQPRSPGRADQSLPYPQSKGCAEHLEKPRHWLLLPARPRPS